MNVSEKINELIENELELVQKSKSILHSFYEGYAIIQEANDNLTGLSKEVTKSIRKYWYDIKFGKGEMLEFDVQRMRELSIKLTSTAIQLNAMIEKNDIELIQTTSNTNLFNQNKEP